MPTLDATSLDDLRALYEDLHANPELSFQERRTAGIVAERLEAMGYDVTRGVGSTGVVGILDNGIGPTVLCRADMDALPVVEDTGLPYASTARGTDPDGNDVGVAHACGHDLHVTWLLGAAAELMARRDEWSGRLQLVFQPAEELGAGARAMIEDNFIERFGTPDITLGQHTAPAPAGWLMQRSGPAMATADSLKVTLHGRGGHGSSPQHTIDPAVLAASVIMRLQTIVSREIDPTQTAVVTVGSVRVGDKQNVIGDDAVLGLSVRTYSEFVRQQVLDAIERIAKGECAAAGCSVDPDIEHHESLPLLTNDPEAVERVSAAFRAHFGDDAVIEAPQITGSEDFGSFATAAGCPCAFWFVGVTDPDKVAKAFAEGRYAEDIAYNHSPRFAPDADLALHIGIEAMTQAALAWLNPTP
ncbi:MAG: amidohydrolase [Actinobacteria bacterium]|nr:amidohydrolase [Actinomycetota bacterium]